MTTTPELARDAGMATAENAADPRLMLTVDRVIAEWAASGRPFSANDIRAALPASAGPLVGARIKAASMRRPTEIVAVGRTRSSLVSTHSKDIAVWQGAEHRRHP